MSESEFKESGRPALVPKATVALRQPRSILHISPSFTIHGADPPPNWWRRFWSWALLGWRWENLK